MTVVQSHFALCLDICHNLEKGMMLLFGEHKNKLFCPEISIDQVVIVHAMKQFGSHIHRFIHTPGLPSDRKLYQFISENMHWTTLAVDSYSNLRRCPTSAKSLVQLRIHAQQLQLFPASKSLESVAIDMIRYQVKTIRGNQCFLIICYRFTKIPTQLHRVHYLYPR